MSNHCRSFELIAIIQQYSFILLLQIELIFAGLPTSDDDVATQSGSQNIIGGFSVIEGNSLPTLEMDNADFIMADCVLKCKSVFKCKLCPRIVCLSEETLKAHLASKASIYVPLRNIISPLNA